MMFKWNETLLHHELIRDTKWDRRWNQITHFTSLALIHMVDLNSTILTWLQIVRKGFFTVKTNQIRLKVWLRVIFPFIWCAMKIILSLSCIILCKAFPLTLSFIIHTKSIPNYYTIKVEYGDKFIGENENNVYQSETLNYYDLYNARQTKMLA